jgi:hypothetical protein
MDETVFLGGKMVSSMGYHPVSGLVTYLESDQDAFLG